MGRDPAFLFYSKDWLEGTAEYMPNEKGVYIDLLCYQHQRGSLPCDIMRLARMVGLSVDEFQIIWDVISDRFEPNDDRLVNRKLNQVMKERSDKGLVNTINGTFAGLLRNGNFKVKDYKYLKDNFKHTDFINYPKEEITERLTEWLSECLKSIEDVNVNVNVIKDVSVVKLFYEKELEESNNNPEYKKMIDFMFGDNILKEPLTKCLSMDDQITHEIFLKLKKKAQDNNKPLLDTFLSFEKYTKRSSYKSLYLTINNWLNLKR